KKDIDRDGNDEIAIDQNGDISDGNTDGYEEFSDPDGSSDDIYKIDGDQDGQTDFLIDTDGDGSPDVYWDPDDGIATDTDIEEVGGRTVIAIDTDGDGDFDSYYDPIKDEIETIAGADAASKRSDDEKEREESSSFIASLSAAILESPALKSLPSALGAIGLVTGASVAVAATAVPLLPVSPTPVSDGFSSFMRLLGFLGKRSKKREDWGVAFDRDTRRPISGARIDIISNDKIVDSVITDKEGRFGFLASPGTYSLQASKEKYELSIEEDKDELYGDLYTGKVFAVREGEMAKLNIAMRAPSIDWKEFVQKKLAAYSSLWSVIKKDAFIILFYVGFIASAAILYFNPTVLNLAIILAYLAMIIYSLFFRSRSYGTITNRDGKPVPFAIVSFYGEDDPEKRAAFAVSDVFGRYYQIMENGRYLMKVQGQTISGQPFDKNFNIEVEEGVVREDLEV
ncbi:MAG: carboxypeptidase-like regulatory domain-containing protein, partial [Bacteroidales bacterium]|nr:carboxypeptidase-like regulatory domain-containing protein [Bacteroidales bacterium]